MQTFKRDRRFYGALLCLALFGLSANLWGDCPPAGLTFVNSTLKELTASASQGDSCSQYNLGVLYELGLGVP
jgi:TPR repeat protein